jgi:uncharacterized repeat protein (TIGR03803 family)
MQGRQLILLFVTFTVVLWLLAGSPLSAASNERVLYSFCSAAGCSDGKGPVAAVIFDSAGNLYSITLNGGSKGGNCVVSGCGVVFELRPGNNGKWTEKVLHTFLDNGHDATYPAARFISDASRNLYSTSQLGGAYNGGTVFEMSPGTDGKWTEKILYSFNLNGKDGYDPLGGLIFDAAGNLYGTTYEGGLYGCPDSNTSCGTVFELSPGTDGKWNEKTLHRFRNDSKDGYWPAAGLVFDAKGNLYGTTYAGGASGAGCYGDGCGAVFELSPRKNGKWTEKVLHSFDGKKGAQPTADLITDGKGNLYGTAQDALLNEGWGTVFELSPGRNGGWTYKVLHSFNGADGTSPFAALIFDRQGNLYGTTLAGGTYDQGTVFELSPSRTGKWTEKVLYSFSSGADGGYPQAGLIWDGKGNLYSTTASGGANASGTVFELTP